VSAELVAEGAGSQVFVSGLSKHDCSHQVCQDHGAFLQTCTVYLFYTCVLRALHSVKHKRLHGGRGHHAVCWRRASACNTALHHSNALNAVAVWVQAADSNNADNTGTSLNESNGGSSFGAFVRRRVAEAAADSSTYMPALLEVLQVPQEYCPFIPPPSGSHLPRLSRSYMLHPAMLHCGKTGTVNFTASPGTLCFQLGSVSAHVLTFQTNTQTISCVPWYLQRDFLATSV
jgi:hypothetical protein